MNKIILASSLVAILSSFTYAQSSSDYNKGEFYVGYSNGQVDTGNSFATSGNAVQNFFDNRTSFHGFEAAGVYNISRYVGLKADVSGTYHRSGSFAFPVTTGTTTQNVSGNVRESLYNVLGGVQVKNNSTDGRFKPFAHAMIGFAHGRTDITNLTCTTTANINCTNFGTGSHDTGFAGVLGGGLDVKVTDKVDFRAFQIDYNPVRLGGTTENNLRLGIGIVIK